MSTNGRYIQAETALIVDLETQIKSNIVCVAFQSSSVTHIMCSSHLFRLMLAIISLSLDLHNLSVLQRR